MSSSWCFLVLLTLLGLVSSAIGQAPGSSSSSSVTRVGAALATSTIVTTVTETSAITVVSGSPLVGIIDFSTTTSTITIINPTSTTFVTVTVTPSPRLSELVNEPVLNVTSTATTTVFTTAFTPPVSLRTRVVTELALTTFAGVTVTVTITLGVPTRITTGASSTVSSTIPSTVSATTSTGNEISEPNSTATSGSSSSLLITTQSTTTRTSSRNTMMTMITSTTSSSSQTPTDSAEPIPPTDGFTQEMDRTRLAGIIISSILLALLLAGTALWLIRRRRRRQKYIQELILPRTGTSAGIVGVLRTNSSRRRTGVGPRLTRRVSIRHDPLSRPSPTRPPAPPARGDASPDSGSHSGLTGEGEVRIVIRPAPRNRRTASSHIFPIPPGYGGQNPNIFVEETTTGETTPENPDQWSIVSDQGSRSTSNNERFGGATGSSSGGRPSRYTAESYPLVTVLSPTPVARGTRRNAPPWEAAREPTPPRPRTNDGGSSGQRSARSGRTDRTGSSGGRAILGGSSRFPNMF